VLYYLLTVKDHLFLWYSYQEAVRCTFQALDIQGALLQKLQQADTYLQALINLYQETSQRLLNLLTPSQRQGVNIPLLWALQ
jgi:hypothetical protein